jgi:hypothetical protein
MGEHKGKLYEFFHVTDTTPADLIWGQEIKLKSESEYKVKNHIILKNVALETLLL